MSESRVVFTGAIHLYTYPHFQFKADYDTLCEFFTNRFLEPNNMAYFVTRMQGRVLVRDLDGETYSVDLDSPYTLVAISGHDEVMLDLSIQTKSGHLIQGYRRCIPQEDWAHIIISPLEF